MSHIPCSLVAGSQFPLELCGADTFFSRADHVDCEEPFDQRQMRVMEDCASGHAVLVAALNTLVEVTHLPGFPVRVELHDSLRVAAQTAQPMRPAYALKVSDALFLGVELIENFEDGGLFLVGLHDKDIMT